VYDIRQIRQGTRLNMSKSKNQLDFANGQFVVYPSHGVGKITEVETQTVGEEVLEMFVIFFEKEKMTLRVPTQKAILVGMRALSTPDLVAKCMKTLAGRARVKRAMWSRRAQEYEQKINSGDMVALAEVVRDLHRNDDQREQSYSERQLYEAALERLTREVTAVDAQGEDAAQRKISAILDARVAPVPVTPETPAA